MTAADPTPEDATSDALDWHLFLLGLVGRVSDGVIVHSRRSLAAGRRAELAPALLTAIETGAVPLFDLEVDFLGDALGWSDDAEQRLARLSLTTTGEALGFEFTPHPADDRDAGGPGHPADRAAVSTTADLSGTIGLWRSFRTAARTGRGVRLYVVEADEDADLVGLTARLQDSLTAAGLTDPLVEVYPTGFELPSYHRLARGRGELLWSRDPATPVQIAVLYDQVDPPGFRPDHPTVDDDPERAALLGYLHGGEPLLYALARLDDVVDRARGRVVPVNYRTDGRWIWSDATTYYLETHRLQPDPALVEHIRGRGHDLPVVSDVDRHRAMATLRAPAP